MMRSGAAHLSYKKHVVTASTAALPSGNFADVRREFFAVATGAGGLSRAAAHRLYVATMNELLASRGRRARRAA